MDDIEVLLKDLSIEDYNELRYSVPKTALQTDLGNKLVSDYAKEIINISEYGLREINSEEVKYLDAIKEYTFDNICPADVILKNWYGPWNGNIKRFLEFITK
jgi:glutamate--cysteine ligase